MKLIVLIDDAGMAANVGGLVDTHAKIFPMPADVEKYIKDRISNRFAQFHVVIEYDEGDKP